MKVTLRQLLEARPCLSERHIRRLVEDNRIPYYKPAGKLLFELDELDEWIEASRVPARSEVNSVLTPMRRRKAG